MEGGSSLGSARKAVDGEAVIVAAAAGELLIALGDVLAQGVELAEIEGSVRHRLDDAFGDAVGAHR